MEDVFAKSFEFVVAGFVAVGGWLTKRTIDRVDELEKGQAEKVSRSEFNATVASMRQEVKEGNNKIYGRIDDLYKLLLSRADERISNRERE